MLREAPTNIMEYVRHLEGLVLGYRAQDRRFFVKWFAIGFITGAAAIAIATILR